MQRLDLTAISDQRRNAGGVNMGWGEWGDWSDMAPIITQTAPVEASIVSVKSLLVLFSAVVEGATNILWYINDMLISEKPSDGNNTSITIFDNDPLDPETDLPQLDPEGVLVPVRKVILKVVNSQEEESIKEWNKYYYINEPDPLEALVDSVSPSVDEYNLQVEGLTFTVNFKIPSSIMWIVDREFTGNYKDAVKAETNVMSSSFSYNGDSSIFKEKPEVARHNLTAIITSAQYGYGCCGVHWKNWTIALEPKTIWSASNVVTGLLSKEARIISELGLFKVSWDNNGGYYLWDFRVLVHAWSNFDGNESSDFMFQSSSVKETSNVSVIELDFTPSSTNHGASRADTTEAEVALAIGSNVAKMILDAGGFGLALDIIDLLGDLGEVDNTTYISEAYEKNIQWEYPTCSSKDHHWLRFNVKTLPVDYSYPETKISVESIIWGPAYLTNRPTIEFEITLPNLNHPSELDLEEYGMKRISEGEWEIDEPDKIIGLINVETLIGEII